MTFNLGKIFHSFWSGLGHLFGKKITEDRASILTSLAPFANDAVAAVKARFSGDPAKESAEIKAAIADIIAAAKSEGGILAHWFLDPAGEPRTLVLENLPLPNIKRWLGVALAVISIAGAGLPIPALGIIETVLQVAYNFLDQPPA